MNTLEQLIKEYEQLKAERDYAVNKVEEYAEIYRRLAASLNMDPSLLLSMRVISAEHQRQEWSNKDVLVVAFERSIENER